MPKPRLKQLAQDGATDGQIAVWNNSAGQWEPQTAVVGKNDVTVAYATDTNPYVTRNAPNSYASQSAIYFRGTTALGTPTAIRLIKQAGSASPTHSYRVFDVTNSLIIAEVTGISSTSLDILDMGTLSNLPTGMAVFEIQVKRDSGGSVSLDLYSATVEFA